MACAVSISIALGTRYFVSNTVTGLSDGQQILCNALTTYAACAAAGFFNALLMRSEELTQGIFVYDPMNLDKPVVISKSAARKAVL